MAGTVVEVMAQAIAVGEGFYVPGTIPNRANNPGDLDNSQPWAGATGQTITSSDGTQIIVFDTADSGWAALKKDLTNHIARNPGQTISAFIKQYSGSLNYLSVVLKALGLSDPNATLGSLGSGNCTNCCDGGCCG